MMMEILAADVRAWDDRERYVAYVFVTETVEGGERYYRSLWGDLIRPNCRNQPSISPCDWMLYAPADDSMGEG